MLNPFPQLLLFSFFAPTLLRIVAGSLFLYLAASHFKHKKEVVQELSIFTRSAASWSTGIFILIESVAGILLIVGLGTQLAALIGIIVCLKIFLVKRGLRAISPLSHTAYILLIGICVSLLMSGAGAVAFDVPL